MRRELGSVGVKDSIPLIGITSWGTLFARAISLVSGHHGFRLLSSIRRDAGGIGFGDGAAVNHSGHVDALVMKKRPEKSRCGLPRTAKL